MYFFFSLSVIRLNKSTFIKTHRHSTQVFFCMETSTVQLASNGVNVLLFIYKYIFAQCDSDSKIDFFDFAAHTSNVHI